jgi:hypothetical protein
VLHNAVHYNSNGASGEPLPVAGILVLLTGNHGAVHYHHDDSNGIMRVARPCPNFLRAVAEACSPQRFREENAVVRFISLS